MRYLPDDLTVPTPKRLPEDLEDYESALARAFRDGMEAAIGEIDVADDPWPVFRVKLRLRYGL